MYEQSQGISNDNSQLFVNYDQFNYQVELYSTVSASSVNQVIIGIAIIDKPCFQFTVTKDEECDVVELSDWVRRVIFLVNYESLHI